MRKTSITKKKLENDILYESFVVNLQNCNENENELVLKQLFRNKKNKKWYLYIEFKEAEVMKLTSEEAVTFLNEIWELNKL